MSLLLIRWFLSRERTLLSPVLFSITLGAALGLGLIWKCSNLRSGAGIFFGLVAVGTTVCMGVRSCMEPPTAVGSITSMELTTLFLVVFLWFQTGLDLHAVYSAPLLAAVLLSLVEICYLRLSNSSGGTGRHHGLLIVGAVLVGIFWLLGLFVTFGAEPLSEGVLHLVHTAIALGKWLLAQLERFLLWLLRFFPDTPVEEGDISYQIPQFQEPKGSSESNPVAAALMMVALGLLLLYLLVQLLRRLARQRVGGKKRTAAKGSAVQREKLRLLKWLQKLFGRITAHIRLHVRLLSMRGTPQELFYFLCRSGGRLN